MANESNKDFNAMLKYNQINKNNIKVQIVQ